MPTKTEQSDLMIALYGRHGASPLPIVAAMTPAQCFDAALDAARIAIRYRTPVILLTDLFLANSSEPWLIPDATALAAIEPKFAQPNGGGEFQPYARDGDHARAWAIPGTPGLMHRLGGIEKSQPSGAISYDPDNHQLMTDQRAAKVAGVEVPPLALDADPDATLLVIGWGSSYGTIRTAVRRVRESGHAVAYAHFEHLNPLPTNTAEVLRAYPRRLVAEMNEGQLVKVLRGEYVLEIDSYAITQGRPLLAAEIEREILDRL
jgi:2-oxoglutarate ferredoxin oxidoreductase subunit alpha